ncbi:MAG: outer membrane beta-barrel family protein, partial [Muribaculaceae bacterium]|nr:outer membrane beta-barrel family protein [Muribaculaceae bacterium]
PVSLSFGNPDLGSARRQSMKLTYMLIKPKVNLQLATGYDFTNNAVAEINYLNDEMLIINTYGNVGHMRNFYCNAYIQWTITPKTRFMTNAGIRYARASQEGLKLSRWNPSFYAQLRQTLPWNIQGEAYAWYYNGYLSDVYSYSNSPFSSAFTYGLSLSRAFLKQDRLNVRLSVTNPFFPKYDRYRTYTVNGDYTGWSEHIRRAGFQLGIQISYRFGSLQAQVKKTERSISNDDLVGRKSE